MSLKTWMRRYRWLIVRLVPLFGKDRVIVGLMDSTQGLAIGVSNGAPHGYARRHAMWLEREYDYGRRYSLNALTKVQRESIVRRFITDCQRALGWAVHA